MNCLSQEYSNVEIVVADDGSTDDTQRLVESFINSRFRLIYVKQDNSGGPASPRNLGLEHSSGKYIQFLDADDLMDADKIMRQVNALEQVSNNTDDCVAYCDYRFFRKNLDGSLSLHRMGPEHAMHWPRSFSRQFEMYTVVHRFLYPKSVLDKYGAFDASMNHTEDLDLWMKLLIFGVEFIYDDRPMALYREHISHSLSHPLGQAYGRLLALEKCEGYLRHIGQYSKYRDEIDDCKVYWQQKLLNLSSRGVGQ